MNERLKFFLNRLGEQLWAKPLAMCVLSIFGAFIARFADHLEVDQLVPDIAPKSLDTLLTTISSSMLVIATFAVASMVSAYASASTTATPRSFALVIADDVSQNALSAFIGAFIFSIVALIALENSYYGKAGRFTLFVLTLAIFVIVIVTFVRWVDRIARLGRLGSTIDKVETATIDALQHRRRAPNLGGVPVTHGDAAGKVIYARSVGYVQRIDMTGLQTCAEEHAARIKVAALPGVFAAPGRALAYVAADPGGSLDFDSDRISRAFLIGTDRTFDQDPRFGLIVLSEIASRALSPGVNDPGTAIDVIGSLVRVFTLWSDRAPGEDKQTPACDRVAVPELSLEDMFEDAFRAIARDGAGTIEVVVRLQKAFASLVQLDADVMRDTAARHARLAFARAEQALKSPDDLALARDVARFAESGV